MRCARGCSTCYPESWVGPGMCFEGGGCCLGLPTGVSELCASRGWTMLPGVRPAACIQRQKVLVLTEHLQVPETFASVLSNLRTASGTFCVVWFCQLSCPPRAESDVCSLDARPTSVPGLRPQCFGGRANGRRFVRESKAHEADASEDCTREHGGRGGCGEI